MYVNTLESNEFVNLKEKEMMSEEMIAPEVDGIGFHLDKVVEAVRKGLLRELLRGENERREARRFLQPPQGTSEATKAYAYYWRLMKEYEVLPIREQFEKVLNMFFDISQRYDPLSYDDRVWAYADELMSTTWDYARNEEPPYSSISVMDVESKDILAKAKLLFIYREIRNQLLYVLKMMQNNGMEKPITNVSKSKKTTKANKKGKFAEAEDKMKKGTINYNDYLTPEDEYYGVGNFDWDNMPDDRDMGTIVIRKRPPLDTLHKELVSYFYYAETILNRPYNEKQQYEALGQLYDLIDKQSDDCLNYSVGQMDGEESFQWAVGKGLVAPYGENKLPGVLKNFIQTVRNLTDEGEDITYFGGHLDVVEGWSWEPKDGVYPALRILNWFLYAIRTEMTNLHMLWKQLPPFEYITKHQFRVRELVMPDEHVEGGPDVEYHYTTDDDYDEKKQHPLWETGDETVEKSVNDKSTETTLPASKETPPPQKGKKKIIDHIEISEDKAKCLYNSLFEMEWLVDPLIEDEFVKRLTANPPDKKIKLKERIQVKCIATHYIYPKVNPKKGRKRENLKPEETAIIKKVFDCENTSMDKLNKSEDEPKNFRKFDSLMRKNGWKSKK